jgi:lipid-binding SYLF domain-containing protein
MSGTRHAVSAGMIFLWRTSLQVAVAAGTVAIAVGSTSSASADQPAQATKAESERTKALDRLDESAQVVTEVGKKIPESIANRTQCMVVVPSMVKGGVVIGAEHGKGFAVCQTSKGWSAPAPITISGGTIGAQLGVQSTDLIALVTSSKGTKALLGGNFRIGADVSATAGPVGTGRGTGGDVSSNSDVVSYSRSKGLFAGAELNGSTIKADADTARALYGSTQSMSAILDGRVLTPDVPAAQHFLATVREGFGPRRGKAQSSLER